MSLMAVATLVRRGTVVARAVRRVGSRTRHQQRASWSRAEERWAPRGGAGAGLSGAAAVAAVAGAGVLCAAEAEAEADDGSGAAGEGAVTFHDRVVGNYENRIRSHSAPEKVFEYFASVTKAGEDDVYMTPDDFMRAITPFNPYIGGEVGTKNAKYDNKARRDDADASTRDSYRAKLGEALADRKISAQEARELAALRKKLHIDSSTHVAVLRELGHTPQQFDKLLQEVGGPRSSAFYELVDNDGDGLLSYAEYIFFVTLLSTPMSRFDVAFRMFDLDGDGGIDANEFSQMMSLMRQQSPTGQAVRDSTLAGGKGRVEQGGQLEQFFGPARDKKLSPAAFKDFVGALHHAVRLHEFQRWDKSETGYLSPYEFAMFLVAYAPEARLPELLHRAERLKGLGGKVSFEDYVAFHDFLSHLDEMSIALDMVTSAGTHDEGVGPEEFRRCAHAAVMADAIAAVAAPKKRRGSGDGDGKPRGLTELQVKIIYSMFDADGDGHLDDSEFLANMRAREDRGMSTRRDLGVVSYVARALKCLLASA